MLGVAVGDALGAAVEFLTFDEIKRSFGPNGISDFHPYRGFAAGSYTDDTQMTLATAKGCIQTLRARSEGRECDPVRIVNDCYIEWLETQSDPAQRRGPGMTCLSALQNGEMGTIQKPINDSKGCGGVMRVAPVGLAFSPDEAFRLAAEFAAITHGHPSGYLTAGFLAELVSRIINGRQLTEAIELCKGNLVDWAGHEETLEIVQLAQSLAGTGERPEHAIPKIGQGWVGEEALAIALFCALKFPTDFKAAVLASVNHSGDSDSTGAICGAILGALLGVEAIPDRWIAGVENLEAVQRAATDILELSEQIRSR